MMRITIIKAVVVLSCTLTVLSTSHENAIEIDNSQEDTFDESGQKDIFSGRNDSRGNDIFNEVCPISLSIYHEKITNIQVVIMDTLIQINTTLVSLKETEELKNWVLIEMCKLEILANRFEKAVLIFDLIGEESAISKIIDEIYIPRDLSSFLQVIRFINMLKIRYTKINGLTVSYQMLIDNNDFNIVNGIMLLDSVRLNDKDDCKYIEKVLSKRISIIVEKRDIELFFKFAKNFDNNPLILDMIPTFVRFLYDKNWENIQYVLNLLRNFDYLDQKFHIIIALSKQIVEHKDNIENRALAVVYNIIQYETMLANHRFGEKHEQLLDKVETSLPENFLPLLYTDLCFINKYYGRYLYVDSDDHVNHFQF